MKIETGTQKAGKRPSCNKFHDQGIGSNIPPRLTIDLCSPNELNVVVNIRD